MLMYDLLFIFLFFSGLFLTNKTPFPRPRRPSPGFSHLYQIGRTGKRHVPEWKPFVFPKCRPE